MLAMRRYAQWQSRFLRYIDTRLNRDSLRKCILKGPYQPTIVTIPAVPAIKSSPVLEKKAIHFLLTGIGDDIYSTVDACKTANEMWIAIERLQQGEYLNIQDVKTNLFWEFGKFTSHDGESIESYYSRFYKMMNEMIRNNLTVATLQVNVQFLQQLQPEWSRFVTIVKQQYDLDTVSYHKIFDAPKSHKSYPTQPKTSIPTRSHATTKHKSKEIARPITPPSELASKEDSDPEQAQRNKDVQKNLALIAKYFKNIYKPNNNNLRTSSNSINKNVDTTPRYKNDNRTRQFGNQRTLTVVGARENVGSLVVQQIGIQCFNCKEFGHFVKECRKPKRVKYSTCHKEKLLLCKQAEKGVSLQTEHADWLENTYEEIDEQELEAHYSFMAKIQEVLPPESNSTTEPLEQVQNDAEYNVFANVNQHSEQYESTSNTCLVEKDDSNVTPDSPDMCDNDIQTDQNAEDEHAALANLKLDVDENKNIQKQLKKANTSLAHELTKCKSILAETGVNHRTNVSRPQLKSNQMKDKVMPNNSKVKDIKTEVEDHHRISSISNQTKSVTACNNILKSITLKGNDLLTGNRGYDLYTISLQESNSSTPIYLMAKASPTQAWLWHRRLCHLNFDYINLILKKDVVIGLPKLKYIKDQLCSSWEVSKAKRSSFKTKTVPSSKGRLNLLHMNLCGPMRLLASMERDTFWKPSIKHLYIFGCICYLTRDGENLDKMKEKRDPCILVGYSIKSKGYRLYNKRTKVSGYDNPVPIPQIQNVSPSADTSVPSQQELDLLFGPLYDEFFNAGSSSVNKTFSPTDNSKQQDTPPIMNIQSSTEPTILTNANAEENTEEVYIAQPDRFVDPNHPDKVYRLRKALYGLKHAPRAWTPDPPIPARSDIVQAVCYCARYQARTTETHLKEVKRIFRYLRGTIDMGLLYAKDSGFKLTEAEYVTLYASCAQVMWMRTQLEDYGFNYNKIPLYCDSQSAIEISCNPMQHSNTRYKRQCCSLILVDSDLIPHDHAQTTKTYYKHQDSRIMKAQVLKTKTSANSDIKDPSLETKL
uniref:Retrovirus-related Pol polyprotein from transposon TNT 1-94 n=1 Tax=Tanacetum cinerariifolium TaxID=118510 RepID=A0A6L2K2L6_TANCI|nr:retrovirus-related Pol polyprotein from transposon TNT 1-94 [Tanacetum cinerariifolium]